MRKLYITILTLVFVAILCVCSSLANTEIGVLEAYPKNPSIGQNVSVLARFRLPNVPNAGTFRSELFDENGRVMRSWSNLKPSTLTSPNGVSEQIYQMDFEASNETAYLVASWLNSSGLLQRKTINFSVGGLPGNGGSDGFLSFVVVRDATRDGDEMRTDAFFSLNPDYGSIKMIIEKRGFLSGLFDDRTIAPDWVHTDGNRIRARFEFTAEQGRWRMKLRWRVNGTEYERTEKFSVNKDSKGNYTLGGGCNTGFAGILFLPLCVLYAWRMQRRN